MAVGLRYRRRHRYLEVVSNSTLSRAQRHPADYRDEIEHAEVAAVLAEVPEDHPARVAHYSGAREACSSIGLSHLLTDRMDLVKRLTAAYFGHQGRILANSQGAGHVARGPRGPNHR